MVSSETQIKDFNCNDAHPTGAALHGLNDEEVANALGRGHPKSGKVKVRKGMEGRRTGLMHLHPHSTRYVHEHTKRGTSVVQLPSMD